eukprot:COSAG02_NODE_10607_length_1901_cov_1.623751_2_plen_93_part_00
MRSFDLPRRAGGDGDHALHGVQLRDRWSKIGLRIQLTGVAFFLNQGCGQAIEWQWGGRACVCVGVREVMWFRVLSQAAVRDGVELDSTSRGG